LYLELTGSVLHAGFKQTSPLSKYEKLGFKEVKSGDFVDERKTGIVFVPSGRDRT